jgi:hypothetical protein
MTDDAPGSSGKAARGSDKQAAVRLPESKDGRRQAREFVARNALGDAVAFLPKDDDELNELACRGRFHTIVFASLGDLLTAIWKGDADWTTWRRSGIRIELAEDPEFSPGDWRRFIDELHASLERWRASDRRRKIIAAVILSVVALLAAACVLFLPRQ